MPVPNLYIGEGAPELFNALPSELQDNRMDLLYVTDRVPETDDDGVLTHGYGLAPGAENGRPLESVAPGFWLIKPEYPYLPDDEN